MRSQFGKMIRESDVCVLCGGREATTREHIPPRGLFIKSPKEYLVVPACGDCNASTKLDDEHLQQVMSATCLVGQGREVWKEKVAPKFERLPAMRERFKQNTYISNVKLPKLDIHLPGLMIDSNRIEISLRKMVSGLYWFHTGTVLNPKTKFEVGHLNVVELPKYFEEPSNVEIIRHTQHGVYDNPDTMETFSYKYGISNGISLWYFFFYKQNAFIVVATEPEEVR